MTGKIFSRIARIAISGVVLSCMSIVLVNCGGGGGSTDSGRKGSIGDNTNNPGSSATTLITKPDNFSAISGQVLSVSAPGVLQNDIIATGNKVTVTGATQPEHGTLSINADGSLTYQSFANFAGVDTFVYAISDIHGNTGTATVTVTVSAAPAVSCSQNLVSCFDAAGVRVAKYLDNKQAAASYTFDDGDASDIGIATLFESFALRASFYIIPSYIKDWSPWKALAQAGHEIGNHSMDHRNLTSSSVTDSELDNEVNGAQKLIEQNIGIRPLVFIYPYNASDTRSMRVVKVNHVASRVPGFSSDSEYHVFNLVSTTTSDKTNSALNEALLSGGWFVAAGHGMEGSGWEPVNSQFLQEHLTYATGLLPNLWIDTFLNVARYRLCREQSYAIMEPAGNQQLRISLGGTYSASLCTSAMTVIVPIVETPNGTLRAITARGRSVSVVQAGGMLYLNIIPGEEVFLSMADQ